MLLTLIKYATLFLIMLNIPGFVFANINPTYSSMLSYLSFGLMVMYFFLTKKRTLNRWMLLMGTLYFLIGSLSGQAYIPEDIIDYLFVIIKYFIIVIGGYEVVKATSKKELILFLLIGALTVFLQIFVYYNPLKDGGRYSGFYLNPNALGFICMMGYALSFGVEKKYRTIGQIAFTIIGFLTFSRTFIVVWLFINILSIRVSLKNIRVLAAGVGLFIGLLTYNAFLPKKNPRLETMSNILEGKSQNTNKLEEDSRTHTWAIYYPALMDKPIFGHGWGAFEGGAMVSVMGPHNAYIKTMGEGGILTLLNIITIIFG